jgi:hypothetical protein
MKSTVAGWPCAGAGVALAAFSAFPGAPLVSESLLGMVDPSVVVV